MSEERIDRAMTSPSYPVRADAPEAPTPPTSGLPPPRGAQTRPWTAGRVVLLVCGCVVLLMSLGIGTGGVALAVTDAVARDHGGYLMSRDVSLATGSYALVSQNLTLSSGEASSQLPRWLLGDAKVEVTSAAADVFVGIAPTDDVAGYLRGVRHATVVDLRTGRGGDVHAVYRTSGAGGPSIPPTDADFWSAQATGSGTVSVVWPVDEGDWTVVMMNADGSSGVSADSAVGATLPWLGRVAVIMLVTAAVGLLASVLMLVASLRTRRTVGVS
jgi:hypothetical protein